MKKGVCFLFLLVVLVGFASAGFLDSFFEGVIGTGRVVEGANSQGGIILKLDNFGIGFPQSSKVGCNNQYECLNSKDSDSSYVYAPYTRYGAIGDSYSFEDLQVNSSYRIDSVKVSFQAKSLKDNLARTYLEFSLKDNRNKKSVARISNLNSTYQDYSIILDKNPINNREWTASDLNNIYLDILLSADYNDEVRVSYISVEVIGEGLVEREGQEDPMDSEDPVIPVPECTLNSDCSNSNECVVSSCNLGQCVYSNLGNGAICNSGNGVCESGICRAREVPSPGEGNENSVVQGKVLYPNSFGFGLPQSSKVGCNAQYDCLTSSDFDSSYIYLTSTQGVGPRVDVYRFEDLEVSNPHKIDSVKINLWARSLQDNLARTYLDVSLMEDVLGGGNQRSLARISNLNSSYYSYSIDLDKNPLTGDNWTLEEINNLVLGLTSSVALNDEVRVTSFYVEVEGEGFIGGESSPVSCGQGFELVDGACLEIIRDPVCGNGVVEEGEVCDSNSISCSINGYSGNRKCNDSCTGFGSCSSEYFCGDGVKNGNEVCDDGENNGEEGKCNNSCRGVVPLSCSLTSARWLSTSSIKGQSVGLEVLGENCEGNEVKIEIFEGDGVGNDFAEINPDNLIISNGRATTTWISERQDCDNLFCWGGDSEYYFVASLVEDSGNKVDNRNDKLIVSSPPKNCGDGNRQAGEECDDGNGNDLDSCSNVCTNNFCGDGIVNNEEVCDDLDLNGVAGNCNLDCSGVVPTSCVGENCGGEINFPIEGDFNLEYIDSTALGIVIKWGGVDESKDYFVERSESSDFSDFVTYEMDSKVPVYMDVGRDENYPTISRFFNARSNPDKNPYYLSPEKSYYYRVRESGSSGDVRYSNVIGPVKLDNYKTLEEIPRGIEGDFRADIVLGKKDFSSNVWFNTDDLNLRYPGGIIFDEGTSRPTHSYVVDGSNNRILGYEHFGYCAPAIKENYALGKPYTKSIEPPNQYGDSGNREFTDGSFKVDNQISFGYQIPQDGTFTEVDVDVDLQQTRKINVAILQIWQKISSFEVYVSNDKSNWEFAGSTSEEPNWNGEMKIVFEEKDARYVRFRAKSNIFVPGQISWMYLAEGRVGYLDSSAISDINNNQKCSIDSDCSGDSICEMRPGEIRPSVILGQRDPYSNSCNGDASSQTWPNRLPARADSLCFTDPFAFSVGESTLQLNLAIDKDHNLYVPDINNHRVLKFEDPFNNDNFADGVIGQDDFSGNECFKGGFYPDINGETTLCFPKAVGIDSSGKLYVLDAGERSERILRFDTRNGNFPKNYELSSGSIFPKTYSIYFDKNDNLYVGKEDGLLRLNGPIRNSFPSPRTLLNQNSRNYDFFRGSAIAVDPINQNHIWVQGKAQVQQLYDVSQNRVVKRLQSGQFRGLEFSSDGDLYWINAHQGIFKLEKEYLSSLNNLEHIFGELVLKGNSRYPSEDIPNLYSTHSIDSINSVGDQLLVIDSFGSRVLYWNDVKSLETGKSADGVWGYVGREDDWNYRNPRYRDIEVDSQNRVWVLSYSEQKVYVLQGPLNENSVPIKVIDFGNLRYKDSRGNLVEFVKGSKPRLSLSFDVVDNGDTIWFTDDFPNARVLRVVNVLGEKNSGEEPYVDIILGQENARDTSCNKGRAGPSQIGGDNRAWGRDTLCSVQSVDLDIYGNVYVKENANGGHDGGYTRILMYQNTSIPESNAETVYDILPEKIYTNSAPDEFSNIVCKGVELCNPLAPMVQGEKLMIFGSGNSGHLGSSFTAINLDRNKDINPQFVLGDYNGFAGATHMDKYGNLYVGDRNYHRLLVYKKPLMKFFD